MLTLLGACGKDITQPPGHLASLTIDSLRPTSGVVNIDLGAEVIVYFNRALDTTTLSDTTLYVMRGDDTIPSRISYDPAAHAAHLTAPLLPANTYTVRATTGIRDTSGARLSADTLSSFSTRTPEAVVIDAGPNPAYTSLAVGIGGVVHLTYEVGNQILKYARCEAACTAPGAWLRVVIDSTFAVGRFNSLALDAQDGLHVSYALEGEAGRALKYALCRTDCQSTAGWQSAAVDSGRTPGWITSVVVSGTEPVAVAVPQEYDSLRVALCSAGCLSSASWRTVTIAANVIAAALAVDQNGRLHLTYADNRLWYATCSSACVDATNWTRVLADTAYGVGNNPSVALDPNGGIHVSYYDFARGGGLRYATCASACTMPSNWTALAIDTAVSEGYFSALLVDEAGRIRIVYGNQLRYSACAVACTRATQWRTGTLADAEGGYLSAKLDQSGVLHVSFLDYASATIMYLR